jgi:hypothetical protein
MIEINIIRVAVPRSCLLSKATFICKSERISVPSGSKGNTFFVKAKFICERKYQLFFLRGEEV